jgi:ribosomal subunit interface protein
LCYIFDEAINEGDESMDGVSIAVIFRRMEHSSVIDEHVRKQLVRLEKFLEQERTPASIEVIIEAMPLRSFYIVDLRVHTPRFRELVKDEGHDIYLIIDSVVATMNNQLRRLKEHMLDDRKNNANNRPG